jgi:hypothetical protein
LPSCLQLARSDSCHHSTLCTTSFPRWSLIERYAVSLVFWWFDSLSKEKAVLLGSCLQCTSALLGSLQGHNSMGTNRDVMTLEHLRRVVGEYLC